MKLKFLDCFAGIGGFRVGLEKAGHVCVGHIEIDKFANIAYNAIHNIKEGEYYGEDIRTVEPRELPDFDILCGGFPCQSFSIAGEQKGFEDTRGTLVFELLRIAKEKQPAYLFFENVPNILRHDKGRTFGTILRAMDELGYDAEWCVLNGKDGWGDQAIPQNRERVFIVGHLRGKCTKQIFPIRSIFKNTLEVKQLVGGKQAHRIYDPSGISVTLKGEAGGQGAKTGLYYINGRVRRLTPKECWRLQGFSDDYFDKAKKAGLSDTQLYKQSGNSVMTNVIYEIGQRFENIHNK